MTVMTPAIALTRVDRVIARYKDCDTTVLRVLSAVDLDAVKVITDIARRRVPLVAAKERAADDRLF